MSRFKDPHLPPDPFSDSEGDDHQVTRHRKKSTKAQVIKPKGVSLAVWEFAGQWIATGVDTLGQTFPVNRARFAVLLDHAVNHREDAQMKELRRKYSKERYPVVMTDLLHRMIVMFWEEIQLEDVYFQNLFIEDRWYNLLYRAVTNRGAALSKNAPVREYTMRDYAQEEKEAARTARAVSEAEYKQALEEFGLPDEPFEEDDTPERPPLRLIWSERRDATVNRLRKGK